MLEAFIFIIWKNGRIALYLSTWTTFNEDSLLQFMNFIIHMFCNECIQLVE